MISHGHLKSLNDGLPELTDSKHRTRIIIATETVPWVVIATTEKTKQRTKNTTSMMRGLNGFNIIKPPETKRIKAYKPWATDSRSAKRIMLDLHICS